MNSAVAFRTALSPNKIIRSKHDFLIVRTKRSVWSPLPTRAVRLANGNTLISDQFNEQVIDFNPSKSIVVSYRTINSPVRPRTATQMNAPYSAYVIGDYTGITPPF